MHGQSVRDRTADATTAPVANEAAGQSTAALRQAALILEPELRTLGGVMVALRHLGERADPIDPSAIAVLAAVGEEALAAVVKLRSEMEAGSMSATATEIK